MGSKLVPLVMLLALSRICGVNLRTLRSTVWPQAVKCHLMPITPQHAKQSLVGFATFAARLRKRLTQDWMQSLRKQLVAHLTCHLQASSKGKPPKIYSCLPLSSSIVVEPLVDIPHTANSSSSNYRPLWPLERCSKRLINASRRSRRAYKLSRVSMIRSNNPPMHRKRRNWRTP